MTSLAPQRADVGDGAAEGFFRDLLRRLEDDVADVVRKVRERGEVDLPVAGREMVVVEVLDVVQVHPREEALRVFAEVVDLHLAAPAVHLADAVVARVEPAADRRALELADDLGKLPFGGESLVVGPVLERERDALFDECLKSISALCCLHDLGHVV